MRMKNIVDSWKTTNDCTCTLCESIMAPEVLAAFKQWIKNAPDNFVLIGGIALSYYNVVRYTQDVDVLYVAKKEIPIEVLGFSRNSNRQGAFLHKTTHVEIEVTSPQSFENISDDLVKQVFKTSNIVDGVHVASKSGLVALKAQAGRKGSKGAQDKADILALLELGDIDISDFDISEEAKQLVNLLSKEL